MAKELNGTKMHRNDQKKTILHNGSCSERRDGGFRRRFAQSLPVYRVMKVKGVSCSFAHALSFFIFESIRYESRQDEIINTSASL